MDIKYLGHASFHLKGKDTSVVCDPFDPKMVGLKFPSVEADIVTISHHHHDHDYDAALSGKPLVIDIAGEYEKKGVRVTGYMTYHDAEKGTERGVNILYKIEIDGVMVVHCGDLGHQIDDELSDELGEVDVLMVPVGGHYTIDAKGAIAVIKDIEPKIIIPMHYRTDKHAPGFSEVALLSDFIKAMEIGEYEAVKKLSLKKDAITEEMKVVVMDAS